jgi:tetratricopeptide (TPR) repeat protein
MADEHQKWLDRGFCLVDLRRYAQAEVELRRALAGEVDRAYAFYLLGWAQAKQGKFAEAEETAGRSIAENPHSGQGYEILGMALQGRSRWAEAEKAARSALACNPQSGGYRADLAWILRCQGRPAEALTLIEEGLQNEPELVRLHISRTGALIELRRWDAARESALHALSLNPEEPVSRRQLGDIAFEHKDYAAAQNYYSDALRLEPSNTYVRERLLKVMRYGFWYYRMLQPRKADGSSAALKLWPILAGGVAGARMLPMLAAAAIALVLLAVLFLAVRWFLRVTLAPVTTFWLRFHPMGRALLSPDEIECSDYVAMLTGGAVLAFAAALLGVWGLGWVMLGVGILFLMLTLPVTWAFQATGTRRTVREAYTWLLLSVGGLAIAALASNQVELGSGAFGLLAAGAFGAEKITDVVYSMLPKRGGKGNA